MKLLTALTAATGNETTAQLLANLASRCARTAEQLEATATECTRRAQRAAAGARGERRLNALGELQREGAELDRLCATLCEQRESLELTASALGGTAALEALREAGALA